MKRNIITGNLAALIMVLNACGIDEQQHLKNPVPDGRDSLYKKQRLTLYNDTIFYQILNTVQTGDMVTRCGSDLTSEMLRRLNQQDKTFSHIGIASTENDTVFIYHAIGGELNPDQKLKREPLWSFAHPADNKAAGVFRLPLTKSQTSILIAEVKRIYNSGVPFDMDFDWATNDRLYCAEFVVKSLSIALNDSNYFNHTILMGREGVAVDDVTHNKNARQLGNWSY